MQLRELSRRAAHLRAWRVVGLAIVASVVVAAGEARAEAADAILGEWRTPARISVQVRPCAETVCARIVRVPEVARSDLHNPEPRLRTRPLLGIEVFTGTRRSSSKGWKGHIYVPETGRTYVARLTSLERDRLQVDVCGPMGLFCVQEIWVRSR